MMESDLDNRNLIENAKISRNYGSTLVRDLRERYGENFAGWARGHRNASGGHQPARRSVIKPAPW